MTLRSRRFTHRISRSVRLVESLYHEALLDRPHFLRFLISLLDTPATATAADAVAALGQLSFVLLLVEEYFADVLASEPCTARLVKAGVVRLHQVPRSTAPSAKNSHRAVAHIYARAYSWTLRRRPPSEPASSARWRALSAQLSSPILTHSSASSRHPSTHFPRAQHRPPVRRPRRSAELRSIRLQHGSRSSCSTLARSRRAARHPTTRTTRS